MLEDCVVYYLGISVVLGWRQAANIWQGRQGHYEDMMASFVGVYGGHYSEHCQKVTLVCCWLCARQICVCDDIVCLFDGCCTYMFVYKQFIVCVCVQSWGKSGPWQGNRAMNNGSGHDVDECGDGVLQCLCTCTMVHCVCICKHSSSFQRTYSRIRNSIPIFKTIAH